MRRHNCWAAASWISCDLLRLDSRYTAFSSERPLLLTNASSERCSGVKQATGIPTLRELQAPGRSSRRYSRLVSEYCSGVRASLTVLALCSTHCRTSMAYRIIKSHGTGVRQKIDNFLFMYVI